VVTGFIAQDEQGHITTLGRGGSDLTASTLGAAVGVDEIQVWKDVDGVMSANPKVVPKATPVQFMSFQEATELAHFGAQVLHPETMVPAMAYNIPVRVKNSYDSSHPGTVITSGKDKGSSRARRTLVTTITTKHNVELVDIVSTGVLGQRAFLTKVFSTLEEHNLCVDVVAIHEVSISLTLDHNKIGVTETAQRVMKSLCDYATVSSRNASCAILSLIADVERSSEVLATVFATLKAEGVRVELLSEGASKLNIVLVIREEDCERTLKILHRRFFGIHVSVDE